MTKFSVVMPVHNEANFLQYSLPSIFKLNPNEVILLLDRCSDKSFEIAKRIAEQYAYVHKTVFCHIDWECNWNYRVAYLRRLGYAIAKNSIIVSTDADIVLDSQILEYFAEIEKNIFAFISFEYIDYPLSFRNLFKRLLEHFKLPFDWLSGIYVLRRDAWLETEDLEELRLVYRAEDTHLHNAIKRKYRVKCVLTKCVHLRPSETRQRHYLRGQLYWRVAHRPFLVTVLSGVILLRLTLIKGYIHERFG